MSFWSWLLSLFFGSRQDGSGEDRFRIEEDSRSSDSRQRSASAADDPRATGRSTGATTSSGVATSAPSRSAGRKASGRKPLPKQIRLTTFRFIKVRRKRRYDARSGQGTLVEMSPYVFARPGVMGGYLDLSRDVATDRLEHNELPVLSCPEEIADWLEMPLGKLAWLVHRFDHHHVAISQSKAHYVYRWIKKRSGGERLIEAPKTALRVVQQKILREILQKIPPHSAAHGFTVGRSILTNAKPHVGQAIVIRLDLQNFYASVSLARVVAIFRSLGYSREAAIWLGRLTTTGLPQDLVQKSWGEEKWRPYMRRHLPQGASTSPALANLAAFSLDLRLSGLARRFNARYTRYADDITFSGGQDLRGRLRVLLPLVKAIIRSERLKVHPKKLRVLRTHRRQIVAGVVVNTRINGCRRDYDRLKAILTNCIRTGPASQNREQHPAFAQHLLGRIAHIRQLNAARGDKLQALFQQIRWDTP